jgi:hypothetical protein
MAGFDDTSLRQGGILAGVPFPLLEHGNTYVLGAIAQDHDYSLLPTISAKTHAHRADSNLVTVQVPARFGLCAVLSNCCDLERRDGHVRAYSATLARLRPMRATTYEMMLSGSQACDPTKTHVTP